MTRTDEWRDALPRVRIVPRAYRAGADCFRHHANLSMLHTGKGGTWHLSLSDNPKATVEELFSGRTYPAKDFAVSSDVPETWLFKLR